MLDLGKLNPDCRFVAIRYIWSQADKDRYDRDGEPPRRHWHIDKRTPIIPLTFLELHYLRDWHPHSVSTSEFTSRLIADRLPSLVVCDLFPHTCIRMAHSRFIMTSDQLPKELRRFTQAVLEDIDGGPLDQYHVDEDEILEAILMLLSGRSRVQMGLCKTEIHTDRYCRQLRDVLAAGFEGYMQKEPAED